MLFTAVDGFLGHVGALVGGFLVSVCANAVDGFVEKGGLFGDFWGFLGEKHHGSTVLVSWCI